VKGRAQWVFAPACALLLALAACGGPAPPWTEQPAGPIDLRGAASAPSVALLAPFEVRLDLWHRQDLAVDFAPAVPEGFAGTVQVLPEQPLFAGVWQRAVLSMRATTAPGAQKIPPFRVQSKDGTVATTPELPLDVTTLLAGAADGLEAPGPPLRLPVSWWPLAAAGALALLLVAGALWFLRRARRQRPPPTEVAVPAHVKALRELQRLRTAPRQSAEQIDAFYVAVSHVLRVYLEERFGLHAPERTTEEFLLEVEAGGPLSPAQCRELRRFLDQCDLVKFAAARPGEGVHAQTLAAAEGLVEGTRPDRAPLEASA
jgi:hypothetical protein